jgi:hypothetical protein
MTKFLFAFALLIVASSTAIISTNQNNNKHLIGPKPTCHISDRLGSIMDRRKLTLNSAKSILDGPMPVLDHSNRILQSLNIKPSSNQVPQSKNFN